MDLLPSNVRALYVSSYQERFAGTVRPTHIEAYESLLTSDFEKGRLSREEYHTLKEQLHGTN